MSMPVGLKDVAQRAGVSIKTVSNVINGYVHVARHRERVAGDRRPRLPAQPRGPQPARRADRYDRARRPRAHVPYFAELARAIIDAAEQHGWTVLIDQTDGRANASSTSPASASASSTASSSARSPWTRTTCATRRASAARVLGERILGGAIDHVAIDNVAAARAATSI